MLFSSESDLAAANSRIMAANSSFAAINVLYVPCSTILPSFSATWPIVTNTEPSSALQVSGQCQKEGDCSSMFAPVVAHENVGLVEESKIVDLVRTTKDQVHACGSQRFC